jgi:hypothetical protein
MEWAVLLKTLNAFRTGTKSSYSYRMAEKILVLKKNVAGSEPTALRTAILELQSELEAEVAAEVDAISCLLETFAFLALLSFMIHFDFRLPFAVVVALMPATFLGMIFLELNGGTLATIVGGVAFLKEFHRLGRNPNATCSGSLVQQYDVTRALVLADDECRTVSSPRNAADAWSWRQLNQLAVRSGTIRFDDPNGGFSVGRLTYSSQSLAIGCPGQ